MTDAYALASPHADRADEAPGVPLRPCARCGVLRVTPCPCARAQRLSVPQCRALEMVARAGSASVSRNEASAATSLVRRGLLSREDDEPVIYTLTGAGRALWLEMTS